VIIFSIKVSISIAEMILEGVIMPTSAYSEITDRLLRILASGKVPWRQPWTSNGPPRNLISKRPYRGINVFLLEMYGHASPYWLTPEQLKKLGGEPKSNEKVAEVFTWTWRKIKENENGPEEESSKKGTWIPLFLIHWLYNTEQCVGIDHKIPKLVWREFTANEERDKIIREMPNLPTIRHGEPSAYYLPPLDLINMPSPNLFETIDGYYAMLFHEIIHSTGHEKRLQRRTICRSDFRPADHGYCFEELIAEMGSAILCAHAGIVQSTIANSAAYIQAWLEPLQNDKRMLFFAAHHAQKAVDHVLKKTSVTNTVEQAPVISSQ